MTVPGSTRLTRLARPPITGVDVVVPAHDEEESIGACLHSLDAAAARILPLSVTVHVVLDDCHDGSAEIVAAARLQAVRLRVSMVRLRQVGGVRAYGLADAPCEPDHWYATTDADSSVPPTWLAAQLASARRHDVFVGTVAVGDWSARPPGVDRLWASGYSPVDGHPHVHAANLGVRASTYWEAGGFESVSVHEDARLVRACVEAGAAVDRSAAAPVTTSARRSTRTPWGFSAFLGTLEGEPA